MADESPGDKTEAATPKRREEARESGHSPKSRDLTQAALLMAGLLALSMTGRAMVESMSAIMVQMLGNHYWGRPEELLNSSIRASAPQLGRILSPILLTAAGVAFVVTAVQVGLRANWNALMPKFEKLNPLQGLGNLVSGQNWVQLGMNLLKMTVLGAIAWSDIQAQMPTMLSLVGMEFPENFSVATGIIYELAFRMAMAMLIIAAGDWIYHRWQFERDIRMSKQEIKDESKNMDGDPKVKGRRRELARKMVIQRIHRDVPKADVVVTNPTELAIALKYDPDGMSAPRVVAKGAGFLAARIRQIAIQNGVPLVERKPLAQALYKTVEVGHEVPPEFYQTIAEILAYVYELSGKGMRRMKKAG